MTIGFLWGLLLVTLWWLVSRFTKSGNSN